MPDEHVSIRLDVSPWLEKKVNAVLAHHSQVERGALPGLIASLPPRVQEMLLSTEYYSRYGEPTPGPLGRDLTIEP